MCALAVKIACNGVKPTKAEIYTLAAELVELENIVSFKGAIISSFDSYDYVDHNNNHYNNYNYTHNGYNYDYYYYYDYTDYGYYNYKLTKEQKVLALLFLAAIYS